MSHIKKVRLLGLFLLAFFILTASNVQAQTSKPQIIAQAKTNIRELPRTGLPLAAWGLLVALPGGLILGKLLRKNKQDKSASSIWNHRNLNS